MSHVDEFEPGQPFSRRRHFLPENLRNPSEEGLWTGSECCRFDEATAADDKRRREKFDRKYMKVARAIALDNTACYSRHIGVVLIGQHGRPLSFGYNGSVEGAPHNDSAEYLEYLYRTLLSDSEISYLHEKHGIPLAGARQFADKFADGKTCPRRLVGAPSGQRLELCNCAHAERNALANAGIAGVSTINATLYLWGTEPCMPCHECALQIVQSKVRRVVCQRVAGDYSASTRGLFVMTGVELCEMPADQIGD